MTNIHDSDNNLKETVKKYSFRTYIKDIFIEVPGYRFKHHPYFDKFEHDSQPDKPKKNEINNDEDIFLGRGRILRNFLNILKQSDSNGVYLVTGYRGMGKTSFVAKTIEEYKISEQKTKDIKSIKISLAQTKLEEIDILRHIVKKLYQDMSEDEKKESSSSENRLNPNQRYFLWFVKSLFGIFFSALLWLKYCAGFPLKDIIDIVTKALNAGTTLFIFVLALSLTYLRFVLEKNIKGAQDIERNTEKKRTGIKNNILLFLGKILNVKKKDSNTYLVDRLNELQDRCFSSIVTENQESGGIKDIVNFFQKRSKTFPIANAKEIEYELVEILEEYYKSGKSKKGKSKRLIFVFDELDKIEPEIDKGLYQSSQSEESAKTYLNDLRERRQIIIRVLSSLKFLLTEAKARFIFIAGREMFDAALADTADRQSALSSVFHQIIYVESFLRENPIVAYPHKSNTNYLIEQYLERILIPKEIIERFNDSKLSNEAFLRKFAVYLKYLKENKDSDVFLQKYGKDHEEYSIHDEAIIKVLFTLQNFITYLSYRTNGSPKKIIKTIEEIFVDEETLDKSINKKEDYNSFYENDMTIIISSKKETKDKQKNNRLYLNLSFKQQYKYAFNAYLFYPFLSMQNNTLSNYSDSVLVSTPYLMDNLIKYHPFAFSMHNLELTPEILSTNKTPELRSFIEELINYLSQNHLRETESGLFQFKFFDKTHQEIAFISKIFDEESAAFNFSLDESHGIKTHIASKIKFLRNAYKDFKKKESSVVESLTFLNDILGDSQLFDEFYEDAVIAFLDSIHGIETPQPNSTSIDVFLLWMRVKLKLAMVYEKMKYYEQAIAQLGVAMNTAVNYITKDTNIVGPANIQEGEVRNDRRIETDEQKNKDRINNLITPLYREILQITQQAILANMYVQEKFAEGLTFAKLQNYMQLYADIHKHDSYSEYKGRDLMMSNFYAHLGTLLFYKNKTLPLNTTLQINNSESTPLEDYIKDATNKIKDTPLFNKINKAKYDEILFNNFVDNSYEELGGFFLRHGGSKAKIDPFYRDFRFSFTTYVAYKKSLSAFLAKTDQTSLVSLVDTSVTILMNFRNVHGSRKLIGLANLITKIADMLLTLFRTKEDTIFSPSEILSKTREVFEEDKESTSLIDKLDNACFVQKEEKEQSKSKNEEKREYRLRENWSQDKIVNINYILLLYYLSARLYLKAGRAVTAAFQLKKILLALHSTKPFGKIKSDNLDEYKRLNNFLEETFVNKTLEITSWNSNSSDRPQISVNKYVSGIVNISLPTDLTRKYYLHLSNNPDTKETVLLFANLKIREYFNIRKKEDLEKIKELNLIGPYNSISHQIIRAMELSMQVRINRLILAKVINSKLRVDLGTMKFTFFNGENESLKCWEKHLYKESYKFDPYKDRGTRENNVEEEEMKKVEEEGVNKVKEEVLDKIFDYYEELPKSDLEYFELYCGLIVNSIFCLHQIITTLNLYGINYMQNYSYLASFHKRMGDWLKHLAFCKLLKVRMEHKEKNNEVLLCLKNMFNNLDELVGNNSVRNLEDSLAHYQLAIQFYQKAIQMHSEGAAYKSQLNNFIYLEDDYNDNLNHFGAALERQQINSGKIRDKIKELEKELEISRLFKVKNYLND